MDRISKEREGIVYGLMTAEERECIENTLSDGKAQWLTPKGVWQDVEYTSHAQKEYAYRVRPELDKPATPVMDGLEFVEIINSDGLGFKKNLHEYTLDAAPRFPDFAGFGYPINGEIVIASDSVLWLDKQGICNNYRRSNSCNNPVRPSWVVFRRLP